MKKKNNNTRYILLLLLGICTNLIAQEVENEYQYRTSFKASFKPIKKLKISFKPEARFDENFSKDEFIFDTELSYKLLDHLQLSGNYRFIANERENNATEYFNRYAIGATVKNNIDRFTPSIDLRFSDYADDEVTDKMFLRYKASVKYDISNFKLTPFVAVAAFHELGESKLFKLRYSAGADYKIFDNNYIGVKYKFDYYKQDYVNRHIFSLGYKIKF